MPPGNVNVCWELCVGAEFISISPFIFSPPSWLYIVADVAMAAVGFQRWGVCEGYFESDTSKLSADTLATQLNWKLCFFCGLCCLTCAVVSLCVTAYVCVHAHTRISPLCVLSCVASFGLTRFWQSSSGDHLPFIEGVTHTGADCKNLIFFLCVLHFMELWIPISCDFCRCWMSVTWWCVWAEAGRPL